MISARQRILIKTEPFEMVSVDIALVFKACIENKIAPMATNHIVPTAVKTKKVILKMRSWFPETEIEPCIVATPAKRWINATF